MPRFSRPGAARRQRRQVAQQTRIVAVPHRAQPVLAHRLVDVRASGADIYVFSFYKVFGPHYAVLWGRRELLLSLQTLKRRLG